MSAPEARKTSAPASVPSASVRGNSIQARGEGILQATLAELAVVGYRALRIERVAEQVGVNKTTIYRRFPTKKELVQAAIESLTVEGLTAPDTGSLRGDLLAVAREFVQRAASLEGQGLFRVMALESAEPEMEAIGVRTRQQHEAVMAAVLERAVARGEPVKGLDAKLMTVALIGPLHLRTFMNNERAEEGFVTRLVDLLLLGALNQRPAENRRRPRPR